MLILTTIASAGACGASCVMLWLTNQDKWLAAAGVTGTISLVAGIWSAV